jgi:hypothetical protein
MTTLCGKNPPPPFVTFCCLCFEPITFEQCHLIPETGEREDVCLLCAAHEAKRMAEKNGNRD